MNFPFIWIKPSFVSPYFWKELFLISGAADEKQLKIIWNIFIFNTFWKIKLFSFLAKKL